MSSAQAGASVSAAALRPRNKRIISLEGGEFSSPRTRSLSPIPSLHENDDNDDLRGAVASATGSRTASPLPAAHPSRATSSAPRTAPDRTTGQTRNMRTPSWSSKNAGNTILKSSYWDMSWSSIQGVASTLLGTNLSESSNAPTRRRKQTAGHGPKYSFSASIDEWGPVNSSGVGSGPGTGRGVERHIAAGSQEDRLARLQAKKREALLSANGHADTALAVDGLGRFKRRMSTDYGAASEEDGTSDTPVYVHQVKPTDTLAGLSIRFNCTQATIRRANRLYPNDSAQVRKKIYIPVDACGVRGRKVEPPSLPTASVEFLNDGSGPGPVVADPLVAPGADWIVAGEASREVKNEASSPSPSAHTSLSQQRGTGEPSSTHDSWVTIEHIAEPVEIVRMPRRTLGFFPPARRRSTSYTDTSPPASPLISNFSSTASPIVESPNRSRTRSHVGAAANLAHTISGSSFSPAPRPSARDFFSPASNSQAYPQHRTLRQHRMFSGPGGVGSLSRTASPGPAMDTLNEFVNTALPAVAARAAAAAGVQLPLNLGVAYGGAAGLPRASILGPPGVARTSLDSVTSAGSELAGFVEGWVRKTGGAGTRSPMLGGMPEPDLIEMVEGAESSVDGRSRAGSGTGREIEEERMLRERFPVRGRVFEEQPRGRK